MYAASKLAINKAIQLRRSTSCTHSSPVDLHGKQMDPKQLKYAFLDALAAQFLTTRAEKSSDQVVNSVLHSVVPEEWRSETGVINELIHSGLTALNNWRHQFMKAIKTLAAAYKASVIRY